MKSNAEGLARAKSGGYAYIMESPAAEYAANQDCNLMLVGELFKPTFYAIGVRKGRKIGHNFGSIPPF